jgi:hypothetical protein
VTFLPPAVVDSPEPRGLRPGLITMANGPITMPQGAQGGGLTYLPVSCGTTHDYPIVCGPGDSPGESPGEFDKIFDDDYPYNEVDPFLIYASLVCGTAGRSAAQMRERVLRRFFNGESTGVERGFARVLAASGAPELAPPDPTNIVSVFATLEQWLYGVQDVDAVGGPTPGAAYGSYGYIHATPRIAAYAAAEHLLERDTVGWRTHLGTYVVFGGGYSGALPGAGANIDGVDAIYATGQVTIWQAGSIEVPPIVPILNRTTNQWYALAEREYAVGYDCVVAAAPFVYGDVSP